MTRRSLASLIALLVVVPHLTAQEPMPPAPPLAPVPPLPAPERPPKSSSTLISYVDIERTGGAVGNAFDAVRLIRPRWLKAREILNLPSSGADMEMQEIHVFLEDRDMGGLDFLSAIPAGQVYTLRYLSLTEAAARYGLSRGPAGPAIVVTLKP